MPCGGNGYAAQVAFGMVLRRAGYRPYKNVDILPAYSIYILIDKLFLLLCSVELIYSLSFALIILNWPLVLLCIYTSRLNLIFQVEEYKMLIE